MKMDELISGFTSQLKRAMEIGENAKIGKNKFPIRNIVISGLGGSGIGGTILSNVLRDDIAVPIIVNKEYQIPAFVNENSLVIISSYSGNTEETLSALMQAFKKDAQIVCITSGGLVQEYAETNDIDFINIDGGSPPRAAFGQSFVQLLYIMFHLGLLQDGFKQYLSDAIALLDSEEESIKTQAKEIAQKLNNKIPVIYSDAKFEGVSIRFRQQINENSKMLCWHHVVPEMNHNELVGWRERNENIAVVFIRNNKDFERNQERMEFTKEVVKQYASDVVEIYSKGDYDLIRTMYLIHVTDWVSFFLAELKGVDAVEVDIIGKLKSKLAQNPF
jgi:glucose/mannose-6-phosphate isomerase